MKITRLEIKDFQQFKDFHLDLAYPVGHEKAGKPLDKVCFIGQSGTGKTTILNLLVNIRKREYGEDFPAKVSYEYPDFGYGGHIYLQTGLEKHMTALLGEIEEKRPLVHTEKSEQLRKEALITRVGYQFQDVLKSEAHFSSEDFRVALLYRLDEFDAQIKQFTNDLVNATHTNPSTKELNRLAKAIKKLHEQNPRKEIAEKLAPILERFNVMVDATWTNGGLRLKTLQGAAFDMDIASTGTKQILLSALPLSLLKTTHKVILFDEPESSLYPDIQRTIIDFYTNLAPEAQFFFATHSPLIASQFEPWEIVELKFNEEGEVYRKLYYEGENHVGNYKIFPEYLSWGDILTRVFDLNVNGNDLREEWLIKCVRWKKQLAKMREEGKQGSPEYLKKEKDFLTYAQKLGWSDELRNHNAKD